MGLDFEERLLDLAVEFPWGPLIVGSCDDLGFYVIQAPVSFGKWLDGNVEVRVRHFDFLVTHTDGE